MGSVMLDETHALDAVQNIAQALVVGGPSHAWHGRSTATSSYTPSKAMHRVVFLEHIVIWQSHQEVVLAQKVDFARLPKSPPHYLSLCHTHSHTSPSAHPRLHTHRCNGTGTALAAEARPQLRPLTGGAMGGSSSTRATDTGPGAMGHLVLPHKSSVCRGTHTRVRAGGCS